MYIPQLSEKYFDDDVADKTNRYHTGNDFSSLSCFQFVSIKNICVSIKSSP